MTRTSRIVVLLALLEAGWLAFDGGHALVTGDYVTPASGAHAGELGPWASLVTVAGLEPRSTLVKVVHLALGTVWLFVCVFFVAGKGRARSAMVVCAVSALWYLPFGTALSIVQIALLAHAARAHG